MNRNFLSLVLRRAFTLRSSRDYTPQIDKLVQYNTKEYVLQKRTRTVHPDTLRKQQEVS